MRPGQRTSNEEFQGTDPRAPFCRPSVVGRLVRRLELPEGAEVLEWGVGTGSTAAALCALGMKVSLVEPDESALDRVLQSVREPVNAVRADRPPATLAGRFALVLLHARDALGDEVAVVAREFLAAEGRVAFVRPVRVLLRPPPGLVEVWERHWKLTLRTPQELLATLPGAGYEPDFAETLSLDEMDALYAAAPEAMAEEAAQYRTGAAGISFALVSGRRREPDEKPRPSRDRG
jgi:hypothetical protein